MDQAPYLPLHAHAGGRALRLPVGVRRPVAVQGEPGEVRGGVEVRGAGAGAAVLGAADLEQRHPLPPRPGQARGAGADPAEEVIATPQAATAVPHNPFAGTTGM